MATRALSSADHDRVTAAVFAAERGTAGEIVTIIADRSDRYLDVALWAAIFGALVGLAIITAFPAFGIDAIARARGGWVAPSGVADGLYLALFVTVILFTALRLLFEVAAVRDLITPRIVKARRVRRRAVRYFRVGAERRTSGRTGVLLY